jgi:hypothetical protein
MNALLPIHDRLMASLSPEQRELFFEYQRVQDEGRELYQQTFQRELGRHLSCVRCVLAVLFDHLGRQFLGDVGRCCHSADRPGGHS